MVNEFHCYWGSGGGDKGILGMFLQAGGLVHQQGRVWTRKRRGDGDRSFCATMERMGHGAALESGQCSGGIASV